MATKKATRKKASRARHPRRRVHRPTSHPMSKRPGVGDLDVLRGGAIRLSKMTHKELAARVARRLGRKTLSKQAIGNLATCDYEAPDIQRALFDVLVEAGVAPVWAAAFLPGAKLDALHITADGGMSFTQTEASVIEDAVLAEDVLAADPLEIIRVGSDGGKWRRFVAGNGGTPDASAVRAGKAGETIQIRIPCGGLQ